MEEYDETEQYDEADPDLDAGALLRAARHRARLSQRELAEKARVPRSTVGRIESGRIQPRIGLFAKLLEAADCRLAVATASEGPALETYPWEELRDRGRRHYPAHLDVRSTEGFHGWWGDLGWTGRERPDYTFSRWRPRRPPRHPP